MKLHSIITSKNVESNNLDMLSLKDTILFFRLFRVKIAICVARSKSAFFSSETWFLGRDAAEA
jgi:hypothetical protein